MTKQVGFVRTPLVPEQVSGLGRSGDLSRMMGSEMLLMAAGWPCGAASSDSSDESEPCAALLGQSRT